MATRARLAASDRDGQTDAQTGIPGAPAAQLADCGGCALQRFCLGDVPGGESRAPACLVTRQIRLERGDHLFHMHDEAGGDIHVIRDGHIKTYQLSRDGIARIIDFLDDGDWLGVDAIGQRQQHASAVALTACRVDVVPYQKLAALLDRQPRSAELFQQMLGQEIARQQVTATILRSATAGQRVALFLLGRAAPAADAGASAAAACELPMSRQDIGDYLGLAPATVSRVLSVLRRRGWLAPRARGFALPDLPALQAIAAGAPLDS